ncbi:uncharacterized protein [Lepeophtheirus salmonis]|uniref:uncharacterized protein n=1 Tax=Lepeophtheirus salmonis TaxID=72036 RepID=UPI001AE1342A|nr:uncharacterized protein LOC121131064 [Lepeophtheirus salmonis]
MELDNFDKALLTPSANSKNRKSNSYDGQVHILKYIITHGKYNSLKDINTWRRMKVGGVCSGLRTAISLKEHFRKQILPHINIKTYPQFSEEDLNKILRGWKGSKTSFNVEVLERSSRLKQNVPCSDDAAMHKQANVKIENSVGPLQKSSRKLINKDKTHFDESFGIINKKEEVTAMPSYKRIKICNLNKLEASSTPIQKYFVKESQDRNTLWLSQTDALKSKEHEAFSKTCMLQSLNYSSQTKFLATWNPRQKDGSKEPEKKERSSDSYSLSKCNNSWYTNDPSNKKGGNLRNGGNAAPPKSLTKNESQLLKSFPNSPNLMINNVKYSSLVNFLEHNGRMNKVQNESEGRYQIFIIKH